MGISITKLIKKSARAGKASMVKNAEAGKRARRAYKKAHKGKISKPKTLNIRAMFKVDLGDKNRPRI